ncbi:MAG: hypothetical protein COX77_01825 [Candidatus Komeilibacteria bacterium CG_4_10_14_0_2_um_filter_37_10]|uniref:Transposase IS200-like domain-containing protein n=1 Tax=Candidatus Komeilibacteria bacterium CG_4_10_14_0_2_um_filter_37_10 TaxID=1974470 RepID=A0A2M7VFE9_9BACT|nr:MAG: hypothetical protein COX77_01825 [Candidatus Komeilibacteria bacterium CG_4_10_14_0_2_um_filter_37_10]
MTKVRIFQPDSYYHIFNRSLNKKIIFHQEKDYDRFCIKVANYQKKYKIRIIAYCFLPNHYHFLILTPGVGNCKISKFISDLSNSYARYYNITRQRNGYVWQGRFKSKRIRSEQYLWTAIHYINTNPIKHKIVSSMRDWPYSSHQPAGSIKFAKKPIF